ncbi:peptide-methionine (S)-S-oxide reductase MsrA [Catenovulum maritimum]|uniref:Peptide methionine sulfoxide reductase MsrA n=1 Tax=Catenovulum maritimum TaxID=1513271 RepID=A0A0J8JHJ4_9ALTE|nr:peptide-methionine (S)-S-oxide reductase MsrA [Catenovulum maritimum]KMT63901.1 hypothetical protein XM47_17280 [Catenovulum maritimum]
MKELATFGGGCFWCIEAVFNRLQGVSSAVSGYTGDSEETANYKDVCTGLTKHVEVVQVSFDPSIISYDDLVAIFYFIHDPTQLNQQGNDVGFQYRSVIYGHTESQLEQAQAVTSKLNIEKYSGKIVTDILPAVHFYPAEAYHQNYFMDNPNQPYCSVVIQPKFEKFLTEFSTSLK